MQPLFRRQFVVCAAVGHASLMLTVLLWQPDVTSVRPLFITVSFAVALGTSSAVWRMALYGQSSIVVFFAPVRLLTQELIEPHVQEKRCEIIQFNITACKCQLSQQV
jgi:hypothetical protein